MTENELLEELARELEIPTIRPDEITVKMFAERLNITNRMAHGMLMKMVESGKLKKRFVRGEQQRILAFSKVEE